MKLLGRPRTGFDSARPTRIARVWRLIGGLRFFRVETRYPGRQVVPWRLFIFQRFIKATGINCSVFWIGLTLGFLAYNGLAAIPDTMTSQIDALLRTSIDPMLRGQVLPLFKTARSYWPKDMDWRMSKRNSVHARDKFSARFADKAIYGDVDSNSRRSQKVVVG